MAKIPVIGITVAHINEELQTYPREYYVKSIREAGAIGVLLPPVRNKFEAEEILTLIDGLLLSGGGDITPMFLNEDPMRGIGSCLPDRDLSEILLANSALEKDIPILGICKGIQVLAIAAGGTIYQDIRKQYPEALEHSQSAPRDQVWHEAEILDSKLFNILGEKKIITVNSFHHQAVAKIPEGFSECAKAPDGIIEGIEKLGSNFCIGVQWHPESLLNSDSKQLFKAFINSAK